MCERNKTRGQVDERNHFIDVLKGVCIIFVIITHFSWTKEERLNYLFPFWIDMAVPIFMIISGYLYTISYKKNDICSIGQAYLLRNIVDKILRYTIPFILVFAVECGMMFTKNLYSLKDALMIFFLFLKGGQGPGSYYYPIMIQFIFLFPIIYFIIKKYKYSGVLICCFINMLFELLQRAYGMNEDCYRLLIFRYILLISVGCYLADAGFYLNLKKSILMCTIGIIAIVSFSYLGYKPQIIIYWTKTSFINCLYIIPLIMFLIVKMKGVQCVGLEIFGRASYNIFLVQKIWYIFVSGKITMFISERGIHLIINLVCCLCIGVVFYYIEKPITKYFIKKIQNCMKYNISKYY